MKQALASRLFGRGNGRGALAVHGVAALAVVIVALGGPVAQFLRIEETRSADKHATSQYRVVLSEDFPRQVGGLEPGAKSQQPTTNSRQAPPPRILRPVADHWEAAARVQLGSADIPAPVEPLSQLDAELPAARNTASHVCLTYRSSSPPARGPPA